MQHQHSVLAWSPLAGGFLSGKFTRTAAAADDTRRGVALAWRKSFTRAEAIEAVRQAVLSCKLNGVKMLPDATLAEG